MRLIFLYWGKGIGLGIRHEGQDISVCGVLLAKDVFKNPGWKELRVITSAQAWLSS